MNNPDTNRPIGLSNTLLRSAILALALTISACAGPQKNTRTSVADILGNSVKDGMVLGGGRQARKPAEKARPAGGGGVLAPASATERRLKRPRKRNRPVKDASYYGAGEPCGIRRGGRRKPRPKLPPNIRRRCGKDGIIYLEGKG